MAARGFLPVVAARQAVERAVAEASPRFGISLPNEPEAVRHLLSSIETRINELRPGALRWEATTINSTNGNESATGADLLGILDIDVPNLRLRKSFLAQAKLVMAQSDLDRRRLEAQCSAMLTRTSASYVMLLGPDGVRMIPAALVVGSPAPLEDLYSLSLPTFMEWHLRSFIGDPTLVGQRLRPLLEENLRASVRVLAISLRTEDSVVPDDQSASSESRLAALIERMT
jgi:hypothetical protein